MINMREEMSKLADEFGYDLLVQRASNIFPCSCTYGNKEQLFNSGIQKCGICNGTSKVVRLDKYKGVKQETSPDMITRESLGYSELSQYEFYFPHDSTMSENDKIYEVGWKDGVPVSLHNIFTIKYVERPRGDNGRIEYVMALTERTNINIMRTQQEFLRNIRLYKNNFIKGGE